MDERTAQEKQTTKAGRPGIFGDFGGSLTLRPEYHEDTLKLEYPALSENIDKALEQGWDRDKLRGYLAGQEKEALKYYTPDEVHTFLGRTPESNKRFWDAMKLQQEDAYVEIMKDEMPAYEVRDILRTAREGNMPPGLLLQEPALRTEAARRIVIERAQKELADAPQKVRDWVARPGVLMEHQNELRTLGALGNALERYGELLKPEEGQRFWTPGRGIWGNVAAPTAVGAATSANLLTTGVPGWALAQLGDIYADVMKWGYEALRPFLNDLGISREDVETFRIGGTAWFNNFDRENNPPALGAKWLLDLTNANNQAVTEWERRQVGDNPSWMADMFRGFGSQIGFFGARFWNPLLGEATEAAVNAADAMAGARRQGRYLQGLGPSADTFAVKFLQGNVLDTLLGTFAPWVEKISSPFWQGAASVAGDVAKEILDEAADNVTERAAEASTQQGGGVESYAGALVEESAKFPQDLAEVWSTVGASTFLMSMLGLGIRKTLRRVGDYAADSARIEKATRVGAVLDEVVKTARASEVLNKTPEAMTDFVNYVTDGNIQKVTMDAETFSQVMGQNVQEAAEALGVEEGLREALSTGGAVEIGTDALIRNPEIYEQVKNDIRFEEDGPSRNEAAETLKNKEQAEKKLREEAERAAEDLKKGGEAAARVKEDFRQQLEAAPASMRPGKAEAEYLTQIHRLNFWFLENSATTRLLFHPMGAIS